MGARNVLAAYSLYAGRVPPLSMLLLAYMAAVAKDNDPRPWFGMGYAGLAEGALGRKPTRSAESAVARAMTPLLACGAVVADRRPAQRRDGANTTRYRLNLRLDDLAGTRETGVRQDAEPTRETGVRETPNAPEKPCRRTRETVQTHPRNRGAEEYEEQGGANKDEDEEELQANSSVADRHAREASDGNDASTPEGTNDLRDRQTAALAEWQAEQRKTGTDE